MVLASYKIFSEASKVSPCHRQTLIENFSTNRVKVLLALFRLGSRLYLQVANTPVTAKRYWVELRL